MFTGLVSDIGEIVSVEPRGQLRRMRVRCHYEAESIALGASIAHSGVCLTVVSKTADSFIIDISAESLSRTATTPPGLQRTTGCRRRATCS